MNNIKESVFRYPLIICFCFFCLLGLPYFPLIAEVIQLKNGATVEGKILELKEDRIIIKIPRGEMSIYFADMAPSSVYETKVGFINPEDAQAHLVLAEYCLTNTLYTLAKKEFEEAARLDENLKEIVTQKIEALIKQESREILDHAYSLIRDEKYELAIKQLQNLLQKYPEGEYVDEANKTMLFAAESVKHKEEEAIKQKEMLVQQKEKDRLDRIEQALRDKFADAVSHLKEVNRLNAEGLDCETKSQTSRAVKSYEQAENELVKAQKLLDWVVSQTQDVDLMTAAKKQLDESSKWLITIYNNLGQLWAYELNFREALKWLNRTLAIDPNNQLAQDLKLKIIDIEARRRLLDEGKR